MLDWDPASGLPQSVRFADGYFGSANALAESRHVFIEGTGLTGRLAAAAPRPLTVAELGFGTGLNFLLSWQELEACGAPDARLHYLSIERYPMRGADLERALAPFARIFEARISDLVAAFPPPIEGIYRRSFGGGRVILDIYLCDAEVALEEIASFEQQSVDAWYLDGFAPARNAGMWNDALYERMAKSSSVGASVATYSAAGHVRRGLERAGFAIERRPGFGQKRECVAGHLVGEANRQVPTLTPWDLRDDASFVSRPMDRPSTTVTATRPEKVIVLGAGLAGAHTAFALARRGIDVTVIEAGSVAGRASGNPQGLLFSRLSHVRSPLSDFSLTAFLYAAQLYRQLFETGALIDQDHGALDGCFQSPPPRGDFQAVLSCLAELPEIGSAMAADAVAGTLGVLPAHDGLWLEQSGWLAPPAVCRALLSNEGIQVRENCGAVDLQRRPDGAWAAIDNRGAELAHASVAITCLGSSSRSLSALHGLPFKVARGQTTQIPAPPGNRLSRSFCHRGYLAPALNGEHCIGATFAPGDEDRELRAADHAKNLADLAAAVPAWADYLATLNPAQLSGRAELRCVSPDYLPLIGPVPDADAFRERYTELGRDARKIIARPGVFVPGLYVHAALGSRGLSYAALGGEVLASQICDEPPPLSRQLSRAVAPARFIIRDLIRNGS